MNEKTILIIEDEPGIRLTLEDRLKAEGYLVSSCADGLSGQETAQGGSWSAIILDIMLPHRDGLTICQNLRNAGNMTPILMLTARNTDLDQIVGLHQGADDYLCKPFDMGVLLARLQALLRRSSVSHQDNPDSRKALPQEFRFDNFVLNFEQGELMKDNQILPLNTQEFRLLCHLIQNRGKVLTRNEILDKVWGWDSDTETRTIDVHVAKLRQHLNESERPVHIQTIRGRGYRFIV